MNNLIKTKGELYIVSTPIGNLEDITIRALKILNFVDIIAAEDTRTSIKLLNKYNIKTKMTSYHKFNFKKKKKYIINDILNNNKVYALISDAGTPCICDPGKELIKECIQNNIKIIPIPGASSLLCAYVINNFDIENFIFEGFLSNNNSKRKKHLEIIKNQKYPMIFFESPHRLIKTLNDFANIFGKDHYIILARELTKINEEILYISINDALVKYKTTKTKGEYVLLISPIKSINLNDNISNCKILIKQTLLLYSQNNSLKDSVKEISEKHNYNKNKLYNDVLNKIKNI